MKNFQDKDLISMFWRIIGRMEKLSEMKPFLAEEMSVPQSIQDKVSELSSQLFNLTRKCACGCAKSATISHIRTNSGTEKVRDVRIVFSPVVNLFQAH